MRATYTFKILDVFLFMVELAWAVVMPIWGELKVFFGGGGNAAKQSAVRNVFAVFIRESGV